MRQKTQKFVAISGTHGTGKTSLLWRLGAKLIEQGNTVSMIEEGARLSPLPINSAGTLDTQLWLVGYQLLQEASKLNKSQYVLSDRTIIDLIAYGEEILKDSNPSEALTLHKLKPGLVEIVRRQYDLILVPDIEVFDFQIDDGVRSMDENFRENIYHRILDIYSAYSIPAIVLKTKNMEDIFESFQAITST